MAKVDTNAAAGTGPTYQEGETVQPTADEYGREVVVVAGGVTVTGGATEAAQDAALAEAEIQTDHLAQIETATEATQASASEIANNTDGVEQLLTDIKKIGQVADSITFTEHTVTNASLALPSLTTPFGFEIQVPDGASAPVYVRPIETVTATGVGRGWEISAGSSRFFNAPNTTGWKGISTAASVDIVIMHEEKA